MGTLAGELRIEKVGVMARNLIISDLDAEHVELLPARTLMTALLVPAQTSGAGVGFVGALVGALNSGGADSAAPAAPPHCAELPWWAPKPPECLA